MKYSLIVCCFLFFQPLFFNTCQGQNNSDTASVNYDAILRELTGHKIYFGLDEALKEPDKVQWISFMSAGIENLPKEIMKFPNLIGLDLSYNNFTTLPSWIGQLKTLKEVSLRRNKITSLPIEF